MTSITEAHPVAPHMARVVVKVAAGVVLFAGACGGVYQGGQVFAHHYQAPSSQRVSYADRGTVDRTLRLANHSPAHMGAFRDAASIATPDVVSVVRVVP